MAAAAVAGVVVAAVNVLPKSTEVPDYQKQVLAMCNRVHGVLSKDHGGEIIDLTNPTPQGPRIRKAALLQVMNGNLDAARTEFTVLNQQKVPSSLIGQKQEVERAQRAWLEVEQANIQFVETNVRDRELLAELNSQLGTRAGVTAEAGARLNAAMTTLAGNECRVTA